MRDKGCGHKPRDPGATQGCRQQKGPSLEPPQEHSPVPPDAGLHLQSLEAALLHSGALRSWAGSLSRGRGGTPVGACVQRREDEAPGCAGELAPGTPQVNGGQRGGGTTTHSAVAWGTVRVRTKAMPLTWCPGDVALPVSVTHPQPGSSPTSSSRASGHRVLHLPGSVSPPCKVGAWEDASSASIHCSKEGTVFEQKQPHAEPGPGRGEWGTVLRMEDA